MKKYSLTPIYLLAMSVIIVMFSSCSKEQASVPAAPATQQSSVSAEDLLQVGEFIVPQVTPGTYSVLKFIDSGNDHTGDLNGYTFQFKADGTLIATINGIEFTGSWRLNSLQTKMDISIAGTKALNNLDDDSWKVVTITNHRITLKKSGPDKVVFVM